jgi:excisionase family DNA binding protein
MRDIMTPEQVAAYLQLNTETIYRLIRDKKLAASKIGRAYRVRQADLDAFLLANSTDPNVRDALFQRVRSIAERNGQRFPDLTSDDLLDELERADEERRVPAPTDEPHRH